MISYLIDPALNQFLVRDKIAEILLTELANQELLAVTASQDPLLWRLRLFAQRRLPWDLWSQVPAIGTEEALPVVNICSDSADRDRLRPLEPLQQRYDGIFTISCLGYGVARETESGHMPADECARLEAERAAGLVRNVLMHQSYRQLGLPTVVSERDTLGIRRTDPIIDEAKSFHVEGLELTLGVQFMERTRASAGVPLQIIGLNVLRHDNGELRLAQQIDTTEEG